jgi:protein-S-isoprenylcysteine O-methyltransferase Ste14
MTHMPNLSVAAIDAAGADPAVREARPRSAVSAGVGIVGLIGLFSYLLLARYAPEIAGFLGIDWGGRGRMDGPVSAIASVLACGIPMVLWSLLVDKVHRNPSTGIDWSLRRPWRETIDISLTKLAGLWATWGLIALVYATMRYYWSGQYECSMELLTRAAPWLLLISVPYMLWLDRRLVEPRDGCYAFGRWLIAPKSPANGPVDGRAIGHHLRAWGVKGFFTAFMLSIVPGNFSSLVSVSMSEVLANPYLTGLWTINLLYLVDVHIATVGYILTLKPLDAHIRTANPYGMAWVAALICYPPFILMNEGGPLDYHQGTADYAAWLAGAPLAKLAIAVALVVLTAIYAWATVAFGVRFSNLTHRGILTHGPYAWTKHPAYVSKNLFWWLSTLPFLATTGDYKDAIRNTVLMAVVTGVYYWRARTEEKHLSADPAYRDYAAWMERSGPLSRLFRAMGKGGKAEPLAAE